MKYLYFVTTFLGMIGVLLVPTGANAYFMENYSCRGLVVDYGGSDFFDTQMYPDSDSPLKPGAKVYSGQTYDVANIKDDYTGLVIDIQNTIGYIESEAVIEVCGSEIPPKPIPTSLIIKSPGGGVL
jgi:hypothetical protein